MKEISTPTVYRILVALKATVTESRRWLTHQGKKMLNVREPHFSQCVEDPYVRGNDVIHSVMDPKVKEMKATKSSESYGCLTVEREKEF